MKMGFISKIFLISCMFSGSVFAASSELYPSCLKGVKEIYIARQVGLAWSKFTISPDPAQEYHRENIAELFYLPVKRLDLAKSIDLEIEPRIEVDSKATPIALAPAGYFIAYAVNGTVWLIAVERYFSFITISRLKEASAVDDSVFSRLYWIDLEEPRFKAQSQSLYKILPLKDNSEK